MMTQSSKHLKEGASVHSYRIVRFISSGGFGNTYEAVHSVFDTRVAIKELFLSEICSRSVDEHKDIQISSVDGKVTFERHKSKFLKEAKRLHKLSHPNIVKVSDVFEDRGTAYYVMDYISGGSLRNEMQKNGGRLNEKKVLGYLPEILDALEYIHSKGLLHLDLKPDNIMLDEGTGKVVLIDFGASKQIESEDGKSTSTTLAYTPGYAPSELMEQKFANFGAWTDIYGLGATLYNMLTGNTPPTPGEINEDGLPMMPGVSARLTELVRKMMYPNRKKRPQSIAELRAMLSTDEKSNPETTPSPKPRPVPEPKSAEGVGTIKVDRPGKPKTKSWRKLLIGGCAVCALIGLIALFANNKTQKADEEVCVVVEDQIEVVDTADEQTFTVNGISFDMVSVEGGSFTMGATSEQGNDAYGNEKPAHQVTLSDFMIGKTEVTQALWRAVMGSNPSNFKGDNLPVEEVSWNDCQEFVKKLNELTSGSRPAGMVFRLPTEAEWEYAARGGNKSRGYKYSGSNTIADVAWYYENSGNSRLDDSTWDFDKLESNKCCTHNVGTKRPNELGLYDMSGNVYEWCQDWYGSYNSGSQTNHVGPSTGSNRVLRGGCWSYDARYCRVSFRYYNSPDYRYYNYGVRVCLGRALE